MKTVALLIAASALSLAMPGSRAHAQAYPASSALPPPGINDPGVKAAAPTRPAATTQQAGPDLQPLTLPAMKSGDSRLGRDPSLPDVNIRQEGENTVQEFSRNGRVFMVVVTPRHGLQQTYMVDPQGRLLDEHGQKIRTPATYKLLEWGRPRKRADEAAGAPAEGGH
ncbi:MAG: DUF2782 domain-containing protein [Xanthomonadaceae bacterium]|nr:DUF2782 domain-containing protein [Xanthomonadaceae bacterium]MDE2247201.1 DUF2782 domain-containing protein [Xanthomonadaceae bacterium]